MSAGDWVVAFVLIAFAVSIFALAGGTLMEC